MVTGFDADVSLVADPFAAAVPIMAGVGRCLLAPRGPRDVHPARGARKPVQSDQRIMVGGFACTSQQPRISEESYGDKPKHFGRADVAVTQMISPQWKRRREIARAALQRRGPEKTVEGAARHSRRG